MWEKCSDRTLWWAKCMTCPCILAASENIFENAPISSLVATSISAPFLVRFYFLYLFCILIIVIHIFCHPPSSHKIPTTTPSHITKALAKNEYFSISFITYLRRKCRVTLMCLLYEFCTTPNRRSFTIIYMFEAKGAGGVYEGGGFFFKCLTKSCHKVCMYIAIAKKNKSWMSNGLHVV